MPELPEVETIKCGLVPFLQGAEIQNVLVRQFKLRWPVPDDLRDLLSKQKIKHLSRRGKYLLIHCDIGTLIVHLGMSGSLRILNTNTPVMPHDHVDIILSNDLVMRYRDPRRFGAILWTENDPLLHPLLKSIGIEPLDDQFTASYLHHLAVHRKMPIKSFIMNSKIVAGIGNIYAAEALFLARIHPWTPTGLLSLLQCEQLVEAIKTVLCQAIAAGGTTLKDFVNGSGQPGYFSQNLYVYGRDKLPCKVCLSPLKNSHLGQRSTVFCEHCQSIDSGLLPPFLAAN